MEAMNATLGARKRIALVAHDNQKKELLEWVQFNRVRLSNHILYATGTTGRVLEDRPGGNFPGLRAALQPAYPANLRAMD